MITERGTTDRGFNFVEFTDEVGTLRVWESSAIGDYPDSFDNPGSSFLWFRASDTAQLNREEVAELRDVLTTWLESKRLHNGHEKKP